jgi:hypothetical protein
MANNKFVGDTSLGASEFHSYLLADTTTRRCLKAMEVFTVPFRFLCDYADQYEEHMACIAKKLEIQKGEIASFHEKSQQVPEHSKGEKLSGLASCSVPLEKARTWARGGGPINMDDVVKKELDLILSLLQLYVSTPFTIQLFFNRPCSDNHLSQFSFSTG